MLISGGVDKFNRVKKVTLSLFHFIGTSCAGGWGECDCSALGALFDSALEKSCSDVHLTSISGMDEVFTCLAVALAQDLVAKHREREWWMLGRSARLSMMGFVRMKVSEFAKLMMCLHYFWHQIAVAIGVILWKYNQNHKRMHLGRSVCHGGCDFAHAQDGMKVRCHGAHAELFGGFFLIFVYCLHVSWAGCTWSRRSHV